MFRWRQIAQREHTYRGMTAFNDLWAFSYELVLTMYALPYVRMTAARSRVRCSFGRLRLTPTTANGSKAVRKAPKAVAYVASKEGEN
jgi:hypothetical protein